MRIVLFSLCLGVQLLAAQTFPVLHTQQFFDNLGNDQAAALVRSADGHLILGGTTYLFEQDETQCSNVYILKVDTVGRIIWERDLAISGCQELRDLYPSSDGGVLFAGVSNTMIQHAEDGDQTYGGDFLIGKIDELGQVAWLKTFGGPKLDFANAIAQGKEGTYLAGGGSHSQKTPHFNGSTMSDIRLLWLNQEGGEQDSLWFGGRENDWVTSIEACQNGDFLLAGYSNSTRRSTEENRLYGNGWLMRLTSAGTVRWQHMFPCPKGGYFSQVIEDHKGRIMVVGNQASDRNGKQFWWLWLDEFGQPIREEMMDGPNDEWLEAVALCSDGGFLLGGRGRSKGANGPYAKGKADFWLIRLDEQGDVSWRNTYGGPNNERCKDVIEYSPGRFFALGDKYNDFDRGASTDKDLWLLEIRESNCDELNPSIFVRAPKFKVKRDEAVRFRARHRHGDRFYWTFGDGTTSTLEQPLKTYEFPGVYQVSLTVFANERCQRTVWLEKPLKVH